MACAANGAAMDDAAGKSDEDGITVDTGTEPVLGTSGGNNGILDILCAVNQDGSSAPGAAAAAAVGLPQGVQHPPPLGSSYTARPSTAVAATAGNHPVGTPTLPRSRAAPPTFSPVLHVGNTSAAAAAAAAAAAVLSPRNLGTVAVPNNNNNDADTTAARQQTPPTPSTSNGDGTRGTEASPYVTSIPDVGGAGDDGAAETSGVKAGASRRRRLMRLECGNLVVLPTNIYKQAGGVKLDLSLGGIRLNDNRCTTKNRAYNFGLLPGFTRENLLALRAFRDVVIPPDRSNATTIHLITAAEALHRYDEEHLTPPTGSDPTLPDEESAGWIPDSLDVCVAVMGTEVEMTVKARELRAVDRQLECKRALESLLADPTVLAGKLDLPPDVGIDGGDGAGADAVGMEPGSTGFCRVAHVVANPLPSTPAKRGLGADLTASSPASGGPGAGTTTTTTVGAERLAPADGDIPTRRTKRRKKSVVAEDSVSYELPTYVQNVEVKHSRSTLRLKMPLTGFLVNGDLTSVADLVVATGLDVTRKNLLALRGCRDAMTANFAGPPLVKRLVAAEIFHVWYRRKCGVSDSNEAADSTPTCSSAPTPAAKATAGSDKRKETSSAESDSDEATGGALPAESSPSKGARDPTELAGPAVGTLDAGAASAREIDAGGVDVAGTGSHSKSTASASGAAGPTTESSPTLEDSTIITLAGPASSLGAPRLEMRMTVGDLRKTRQNRSYQFKQLLHAMITDPSVQAHKLDVATSTSSVPVLTMQNSSGAAAAAAAASAQAMAARALEDTTRAMALLASGRELDGGQLSFPGSAAGLLVGSGASNWRGGGGFANGIGWDPLLGAARAKRGRDCVDLSGEGDGGTAARAYPGAAAAAAAGGGEAEYLAAMAVGSANGVAQQEGFLLVPGAADEPASKRRRQLWMLAIRENELRYERRKEEARKAYEARQGELLRWMVDEEAGRHTDWNGDAGPPPMAEAQSGAGSLCSI